MNGWLVQEAAPVGHRKHLWWVVPAAGLVAWSLIQQWRAPATVGQRVAQLLRDDGIVLRGGRPLLEYLAKDTPGIGEGLKVEVVGEVMDLPATVTRVVVDVAAGKEMEGREVELVVEGAGLKRTLRRAADVPVPSDEKMWALSIIGNELSIPRDAGLLRITTAGGAPPLRMEVRGVGWIFRRNPTAGSALRDTMAKTAGDKAIIRAIMDRGYVSSGVATVLDAARVELLKRPDEELLKDVVAADAGVLERCEDPRRAAELGLLQAVMEPVGATGFYTRGGFTVYALTSREDIRATATGHQRCTVLCFNREGREVWHGDLDAKREQSSDGLMPLLYRVAALPRAGGN